MNLSETVQHMGYELVTLKSKHRLDLCNYKDRLSDAIDALHILLDSASLSDDDRSLAQIAMRRVVRVRDDIVASTASSARAD